MADDDLQEWMANVGLSAHTSRLAQLSGVGSLQDLAKSTMDDAFVAENLGMSPVETKAFTGMRATAREIFGVPGAPPTSQTNYAPTPPVSSTARPSPLMRTFSLDTDFGTEHSTAEHVGGLGGGGCFELVDLRQPLNVTVDAKLKVLELQPGAQLLSTAKGQRVVKVGGKGVRTALQFRDALQSHKANGDFAIEIAYEPISVIEEAAKAKVLAPSGGGGGGMSNSSGRSSSSSVNGAVGRGEEEEEEEEAALAAAISASEAEAAAAAAAAAVAAVQEVEELARTNKEAEEGGNDGDDDEEAILAAVLKQSAALYRRSSSLSGEQSPAFLLDEGGTPAFPSTTESSSSNGGSSGGGAGGSTTMVGDSVEGEQPSRLVRSTSLHEDSAALREVYRIPREKLKLEEKPFARGGGGQIFKGKYQGNAIAAKEVFGVGSGAMSESDRLDFDSEVGALTKLSHPCIMSLYGICDDPEAGGLFMVIEYCGGGDLAGYYQDAEFTKSEFCRVGLELLSGMSYIHGRGIAHRDLKTENVLLEKGTRKVKIADFGLARANKTMVTRGIGTPMYMPPEMFNDEDDEEPGAGATIFAVDIYALGVILWQLWFQQVPFKGKTISKIMRLVTRGKRPPMDFGALSTTASAEERGTGDGEGGEEERACLPPPPPLVELINKCWAQKVPDRPLIDAVFSAFDDEVEPSVKSAAGHLW